jgi:hypothetical protein
VKPLYFTYVVEKHNGVGEVRSRRIREQERAKLARIRARERSWVTLLLA